MRRSIAPWAALAGSLLLTLAAAGFLYTTEATREHARFVRAMRGTEDRIAARIELHATLLRGTAALLAAHPGTDAARFHDYVARLDLAAHQPGLQGIGYAVRVRPGEAPQVESELRAAGFPGLRIWPDQGREERSAILWLEPLERRNRAAIGYDMLSDPVRREAMERARDTGSAALSGKVTLVQEIDAQRQPGFLLYVPVFRGGSVPPTVEERRQLLLGWAYSPFRAGDIFDAMFGGGAEPSIDFRVYDGPSEDPEHLLHELPKPAANGHRETAHMQFGGREWTLTFVGVPGVASTAVPTALALLAGFAISAIIFLLSQRETGARERAERAVGELRKSLEERSRFEVRLREEARVNAILRRLGIALASELDPDRLAQLVADEAAALTEAELGALFDAQHHRLALSGALRDQHPDLALQHGCATVERTFHGERAVRMDDVSKEGPVFAGEVGPMRGYLAVPVVSRFGEVLGGLFFAHSEAGHFTEQHERLVLGLAAQASIAFDNARLLRDLQEADRRKDEFLAVLGHELRNPLAPVVTALEVIKRDPQSASRQLAVIERQARHMVRIVDDLLDVSRITRGKIELKKQLLPVREALHRAAEAVAPLARGRKQKLSVTPPAEPLLIDADPVRLEQILGNLLTNAIKYTPAGGAIDLSAVRAEDALQITVRDTGIGIAPEAQQYLFDPFVQVPGAKDYAKGGLGIGLALVKGLVQLHGGTVEVHSEGLGKGSVFTVRLPGAARGETPREAQPIAPAARRGKVLVVDDNVDAALTLAEAVRLDAHDVRVAHDGPSAVEQASEFQPDVVLLDIGLPGFDGYEAVRRMRKLPQAERALIVALTGFGQEADRARALEAGFDDHLVKPVDLATVHAVLRRRLGAA